MSSTIILETPRLMLRELVDDDLDRMAEILGNPIVMQHYPATKTRDETAGWIAWCRRGYRERGHAFWATIHKADNRLIGNVGIVDQQVDGETEHEVGYILDDAYWGRGLATEAAAACMEYGRARFGYRRFISLILPENYPSRRVAAKNGLRVEKPTMFKGFACLVYVREFGDGGEEVATA